MKLFLVKLGKVWKTLFQQGLIKGSKRVFSYLWIYLRNILKFKIKGDVLIVGSGVGDVAHYRIFTQAEELNLHGIRTKTILQDSPFLFSLAKNFSVFILARPVYTTKMAAFFEKLKKLNKTVIFETDDLVFDAKYMHQTESYKQMNALEKSQYEKGVGEEIIKDPYVKTCSTTTHYLKKILEGCGKKVFLSTNKISRHELEVAERINRMSSVISHQSSEKIRIGYFSGTMSHNKDFATISDALYRIMEKYSQVELVLVGPLEIKNKLNAFKKRIKKTGLVSRDKLYENISQVDINLAPLVKDDPFCEAKSELKFFEAGIVKVPSIAVRNDTYSRAIVDGVDGFLAETEEEWLEKLEKLILDKDLRRNMGEKAYQTALEKYSVKNSNNEEYYSFLKSKIKN